MKQTSFITAAELAAMLGVSVGHAYKIIHQLNDELAQKGYPHKRNSEVPMS